MPPKNNIPVPTEEDECVTLVQWLEVQKFKFSHLAQSTFTTSWSVKRRNEAMGVRSGVPDYMIILPQGLLFIEMKKRKGGRVSDSQAAWIEALNKLDGVEAVVCEGALKAINHIKEIIE